VPGLHIENFGCRAARADSEAIGERVRALAALEPLAADVVVVNTCSVTAEADREARAYIRRAHRRNSAAKIVVTGCYAQRAPEELAAMPGVSAVIGNSHKALAPEIILNLAGARSQESVLVQIGQPPAAGQTRLAPHGCFAPAQGAAAAQQWPAPVWADDGFAHSFLEEAQLVPGEQTRPNLKIQEGCSNRCTFCVIPFTRGPSKSLPYAVVMRQVRDFVAAGGKELVLSGINLGRYSSGFGSSPGLGRGTLASLVRAIFDQTELPRLRLSSIEPMDWDADLIGLMSEFGGRRLARHAHLPLQSGSDSVLRRMHRRYRPWHYAAKVEALISAAGSDLTLGADVMVGFPGETDREFEEAIAFIRDLPFGYLHLFPFSPRPGTALHAAAPLAEPVIKQRMARLRALAQEKTRAHRRHFLGRDLHAITLNTPVSLVRRGRTAALTENFLPVELDGHVPANQLVTVLVTGLNGAGELVARRTP
jgi:threonylcarbamoyladenosine tRNA methylthiotransferase MtaB